MMLMTMMFHYLIMGSMSNLDSLVLIIGNYSNKYYIDRMIELDGILIPHWLLLAMMMMVKVENYQYKSDHSYLLEYLRL